MTTENPQTRSGAVEVTQADRDAAADVWRDFVARTGEVMAEKAIRTGGSFDFGIVQYFARHRLAAYPSPQRTNLTDRIDTAMTDVTNPSELGRLLLECRDALAGQRTGASDAEAMHYLVQLLTPPGNVWTGNEPDWHVDAWSVADRLAEGLPLPDRADADALTEATAQKLARIVSLIRHNLEDEDRRMAVENCDALIEYIESGELPHDLSSARKLSIAIRDRIGSDRSEGRSAGLLVRKVGSHLTSAFARAAAQPQVPEGWKLVPVEPTEAMLIDGGLAFNDDPDVLPVTAHEASQAWSAMLAAAPTQGGA